MENRTVFWLRFGVGLRNGSFFEANPQKMPESVALLLVLREQGVVSDEQLDAAWRVVRESRRWAAARQESEQSNVEESRKPHVAKRAVRRS